MIISLVSNGKLYSTALPAKISGKYWISDEVESGKKRKIADVEGVHGNWILHASAILAWLDHEGREVSSVTLASDMQVIKAVYRHNRVRTQFYIEPTTDDRQTFERFFVSAPCQLNIGRAEDNHIVIRNHYVSAHHACLIWHGQYWSITDTQSSNGTFLNNIQIATKHLSPSDVVYVMGVKIVVGNGFFAINNPDGCVHISNDCVHKLQKQEFIPNPVEYDATPSRKCFTRSPNIHKHRNPTEIKVDGPPALQQQNETPLALLMGPALTMGMTAVVMGSVSIINLTNGNSTPLTAIPSIVMSFSMLCGTVLWPTLTRKSEKKRRIKAEQLRQKLYREYLDQIRNQIFAAGVEQKNVLMELFPSSQVCEDRIEGILPNLWERTADEDHFLSLRLGLGSLPIDTNIHFPEEKFYLLNDTLQNELMRLKDEPKTVLDVPITCSLIEQNAIGIVGESQETNAFLQGLVLQLTALHSYEEVKLVFLVGGQNEADWLPLRMIPHTWDSSQLTHYWATTEEDGKALSASLEKVFQSRLGQDGIKKDMMLPHYVFIVLSAEYARGVSIFRRILSSKISCGFSCIVQASSQTLLPIECSMIINLAGDNSMLFNRNKSTELQQAFRAEYPNRTEAGISASAMVLANLMTEQQSQQFMLPNMLTFMELYGVGKVEHLNALSRWHDNSPVNSLAVPIGIGQDGQTFYLDLHEKAHGPHGLVAGMTGSGKSEFILTFVLSMALNYHPDEVSFILIDYKGGGLAGAFEDNETGLRLPHLVGTITNLDGTAINRALISIQSELRRRQSIFNQARQISGEGTVDIYKYQKMYRSGMLKTPVPHLFIISDEFAELKAQQSEFMGQLISTARIGRSLGVHLILATQKPSGVVDDQIWSNSRFRVCLKVQERTDSMDMLKRPDAAELSDTGRFYLQVGFNELFDMGQSAWCGAPYIPADRPEKKRDNSVEVLDHVGRVLVESKAKVSAGNIAAKSQIVAVVSYLSQMAEEENIQPRQLWLPPISAHIYLDDLCRKYDYQSDSLSLGAVIGEFDDPFNQSQGLLTLDFSKVGNTLLYGAVGSGKTTLINTILCHMIRSYDVAHLNVYIMDMGEETFRAFEKAPQIGSVLFSTDEDKVQNLFKMLKEEITRRKKLFALHNGDYVSYCRSTGEPVPHILVVLRNYSAFSEQFDTLDDQLLQITRECVKYGIYFLVTANTASAIRYRITQNFGNILALQLNDRGDYVGLLGSTGGVYPSKIKGRGIFKADRIYEFQTAYFAEDAGLSAIRTLCNKIASEHTQRAKQVPHLPEYVTKEYFGDAVSPVEFPIGVEKASLRNSCINLERSILTLLLSNDEETMAAIAQGISEQLGRLEGTATVLDGADIFDNADDSEFEYLHSEFEGCIKRMFEKMLSRNQGCVAAANERKPLPDYDPEYVIITGLQNIHAGLDAEYRDKLLTMLEKAEVDYNMRFMLCDTVRGLSSFAGQPWYRRYVTGMEGIWVGDGITNQNILKINRVTNALYSEVPRHFGYVVRRGKPTLIKLLVSAKAEGMAGDE